MILKISDFHNIVSDNFSVIEMYLFLSRQLIRFMSLAGDEHNIVFFPQTDCFPDGFRPVFHRLPAAYG